MIRLLLLAALLLGAGTASAQSTDKPGRAALDGELACGGQARSAECAIALFFTCAARLTEDACARVGLTEMPKLVDEPHALEFAVDRTSTIRPEDITDDTRHLTWFRAGFLLAEAKARRCPAEGSCAGESWDDWQVYLREEDGRFFVVYWRGDSEPETPPEIPEAFLPAPATPPGEPETPR